MKRREFIGGAAAIGAGLLVERAAGEKIPPASDEGPTRFALQCHDAHGFARFIGAFAGGEADEDVGLR